MKININQMMNALMENQEVTVIINGEYYDFEPTNIEHGVRYVIMNRDRKEGEGKISDTEVMKILMSANEEYREEDERNKKDPYKEWDILCGVC